MGRVIGHDCDDVKGLIALSVIDQLPSEDWVGLLAHLDGCRECREDARHLRKLKTVLGAADLDHLDESEMPAGLSASVLGRLREDAAGERLKSHRRMRYFLGAGAGVAAAAAVAVLLVVLPGGAPAQSKTVALSGSEGSRASVQLTSESWGTSLRIDESGQPAGEVMWVWMRTKSGSWWEAGTYRSVGRSVQVDLACALKLSQIESVWVRDSTGRTVVHGYLAASARPEADDSGA